MQSMKVSAKTLALFAAAGAVAIMGVGTVMSGGPADGGGTTVVANGGESTQGTPPSTPSVESAVPAVKATKFAGGDWTGM